MKPYYEHAGITIYHGDCREILPQVGRADLLLTDPPYGMKWDGKKTRGKNGTGKRGPTRHYGVTIAEDDAPFDPSFLLTYPNAIIWGFNHFPNHLKRGTALVWLKRYDDGFGSFLSDGEIAWMSKGCGVYCRRDVSLQGESSERSHPTQKPVGLMKWCIGFFPGVQSVLDPFCGSGTTLVAAKDLGLTAVGIEIEERYCEIAAQRLSQEVMSFA